ncbi:hypothetical protein WICMUC_000358 [Wickerhamomyces mucosus]|uniref:Uncharacterized protein n=1 Tax=Wickerhamomyces mucosus TaxID=1378264 RepID=A0A9P8PZI5_9ASCO|nr:hypothetical protein WICMUC_000358 [Wickerhamomyces mucosus]
MTVPSANTTVKLTTFSFIVPYLKAFVPEQEVLTMPPIKAPGAGSQPIIRLSSPTIEFNSCHSTPDCTVTSKSCLLYDTILSIRDKSIIIVDDLDEINCPSIATLDTQLTWVFDLDLEGVEHNHLLNETLSHENLLKFGLLLKLVLILQQPGQNPIYYHTADLGYLSL